MSDKRRHTDVWELGWADVLAACARDPYVRAEGHDDAATQLKGRLVRFNVAVQVLPETAADLRVHTRALVRSGDVLVPAGSGRVLTWHEWDWVSWHPMRSADGRRFKITHEGESSFGHLEIWNERRLVDRRTGRIVGEYDDRAAAVAAALMMRVA